MVHLHIATLDGEARQVRRWDSRCVVTASDGASLLLSRQEEDGKRCPEAVYVA